VILYLVWLSFFVAWKNKVASCYWSLETGYPVIGLWRLDILPKLRHLVFLVD